MPISCLNCCRGGDKSKGKQGEAASEANGNVSAQDGGGQSDRLLRGNGPMPCAEDEGRDDEPVYAVVAKDRSGRLVPVPESGAPKAKKVDTFPPPIRGDFLVSFVIDPRGGAMKGCRGSGLRIIMPAGAVEQPVRVTCRFVRPGSVSCPPRLMERDSLASGIIEMGPAATNFSLPVLVEIPHFAALGGGDRELIVLRSDDGEGWREHSTAIYDEDEGWNAMGAAEGELYQDIVATTGLASVLSDLETKRIVRISTTSFPKYFALVARAKAEIVSVGPEGGRVARSYAGAAAEMALPANAVRKRVKVGLQLLAVPQKVADLVCGEVVVEAYPILNIYPARRMFHEPLEITMPVRDAKAAKERWKNCHPRILCSLAKVDEAAQWEDVTDTVSVRSRTKGLQFDTKISAAFWLLVCRDAATPATVLRAAEIMYRHVARRHPYVARMSVFYRKHAPFAWCDCVKVYCAVNNQVETFIEQRHSEWELLLDRREIELKDGATYAFDLANGMTIAWDCQKEAGAPTRITFDAATDNIISLAVKRDGGGKAAVGGAGTGGNLVVREEIAVPELDRTHAENHSTWTLRFGGQQPGGGAVEIGEEVDLETENHNDGTLEEEQYEAVGVSRIRDVEEEVERIESRDETSKNALVEEEEEEEELAAVTEVAAVSFEDQATLKIRQTPPPPLPPKRNSRKMGEHEAEAVAVEVNATVSLRSSRSASPADKSETLIQLHLVEDADGARLEFPVTCEKPEKPATPAPDDGVLHVRSGSETSTAVESDDEEILIVETEREVYEGSPVTVTDAVAIAADRDSPVSSLRSRGSSREGSRSAKEMLQEVEQGLETINRQFERVFQDNYEEGGQSPAAPELSQPD